MLELKSQVLGKVSKHKFITAVSFSLVIFSSINFILIYQFIRTLKNI